MVLVGIAHHILHGSVVVLHLPALSGSGSEGAAQDKPNAAPPAAPAVVGRASEGDHGWPSATGADAAGWEDARGRETRGVRHGCRDCRILMCGVKQREEALIFPSFFFL